MQKKYGRNFLAALCSAMLLAPASASAKKLQLIYVPLDNRPVCLEYVQESMEAANCKLILPPEKYLAANDRDGDPEGIWDWLERKAPKADAAVISTDSLLYGGLVASRTHHIAKAELERRLQHLYALKTTLPIRLYAFSTIMRTPQASKGRVEPPYYSSMGPSIYAYSRLLDKKDQNKLSPAERLAMQAMERNLSRAELADWLERRAKNLQINKELTHMARNGKFHYLAIGKDDNAVLSSTHMEARQLSKATFGMPPESFQILDGVDQLGLLLLVRAYNEASGLMPKIFPLYAPGAGSSTLPQYSDARLRDSVPQQITAVGAKMAADAAAADLLLAINTPSDGVVKDSTADDNQFFASPTNKSFISTLENLLARGTSVSLADISYSNGADNGFMNLLFRSPQAAKLAAYNGWNTADNAIGYAIAQGLLASRMSERDRLHLLRTRVIDDWYYQSNARREVKDELEKHSREDLKYDLGAAEKPVLLFVSQKCEALAKQYTLTMGTEFKLRFPWKRLFEVDVEIEK